MVPDNYEPVQITITKNPNYSETLLYLINLFAKSDGFTAVLDIIKNKDDQSRVPFRFLNQILLYTLNQFIEPYFSVHFFTEFTELIFQRIKDISESELKDLKHEEILSLLVNMGKLSNNLSPQTLESNKLELFLRMLKCSFMEKRIKGLSEINTVIENIDNNMMDIEEQKSKFTENDLEKWLIDENLVGLIYNDRPHVEIVKRSGICLKFLVKKGHITENHIKIIWESLKSKHESYIRAVYLILGEICGFFKEDLNDILFSYLSRISLVNYDEQLLQLIFDFSCKAISISSQNVDNQKWYGVGILENLMLDSSPIDLNKKAVKCLGEILIKSNVRHLKKDYLNKIYTWITENNSAYQAIRLLLKIVQRYSSSAHKTKKIQKLQSNYNIVDLAINNLNIYIQNFKQGQVSNKLFSHDKNIKIRLKLLDLFHHLSDRTISLTGEQLGNI